MIKRFELKLDAETLRHLAAFQERIGAATFAETARKALFLANRLAAPNTKVLILNEDGGTVQLLVC